MVTPDALAKSAREKLALALNALQDGNDSPVELLDLAEPIAQTMGILHRIERSKGQDLTGREQVLANIRGALSTLQGMSVSHPAIDAVMEQVAGCLATAHQLSRMSAAVAPAPAPVAAAPAPHAGMAPIVPTAPGVAPGGTGIMAHIPPPQPLAPAQPVAPVHVPEAIGGTHVMAPVPRAPMATVPIQPAPPVAPAAPAAFPTQPLPQPAAPVQAFPAPNQTVRMNANQIPAVAQAQAQAQAQPQPQPQPQSQPQQSRPAPGFAAPTDPLPQQAPAATSARPAAPKPAASQSGNVVVELGTHSVSNFYKGLGGNDVIEHGGLFVATYKIPKMGAQVNLRVLLPGDYEFQATGTVQWIREPSGGDGTDPGFGARFTQITPEGRQLVYRYTRNREPMFYDDL